MTGLMPATTVKRSGAAQRRTVTVLRSGVDGSSGSPTSLGRFAAEGGGWRRPSGQGGRLAGRHTGHHCSCGSWSGPGSPCPFPCGEAKEEGEARHIDWVREWRRAGLSLVR